MQREQFKTLADLADQLNRIESLLLTRAVDRPLSFDEARMYVNLSASTLYKKTANGSIKHFKSGKKLVFRKIDLDNFLLRNPVKTTDEIGQAAVAYVAGKRR